MCAVDTLPEYLERPTPLLVRYAPPAFDYFLPSTGPCIYSTHGSNLLQPVRVFFCPTDWGPFRSAFSLWPAVDSTCLHLPSINHSPIRSFVPGFLARVFPLNKHHRPQSTCTRTRTLVDMASSQGLPTGLSNVLNKPDDHRDSAYYSSKGTESKRERPNHPHCRAILTDTETDNSLQSSNGLPPIDSRYSRAESTSTVDMTPSPISTGPHLLSLDSPTSGAMSVASMVSPTSYQGFSQVYDHSQHGGDYSRRESVDSRLGTNFGEMRLASSPYGSANPSTTSLQSTLAQQRNPGSAHPDRNSGALRLSNGYHPNHQRLPDGDGGGSGSARNAPQITGPASGVIARAPEPTIGQAWAFPEPEVRRIPLGARPPSEDRSSRQGTSFYDDSRRSSFADSVASSSQYTTPSQRLPAGQRRLDENARPLSDFQRDSSEFHMSTHHHSLQHRQISELQGDGDSPTSSQPYSRTPELRVSHKLAERKRRLEMKDLFDSLRALQSVERGAKASKWEILSKGMFLPCVFRGII